MSNEILKHNLKTIEGLRSTLFSNNSVSTISYFPFLIVAALSLCSELITINKVNLPITIPILVLCLIIIKVKRDCIKNSSKIDAIIEIIGKDEIENRLKDRIKNSVS